MTDLLLPAFVRPLRSHADVPPLTSQALAMSSSELNGTPHKLRILVVEDHAATAESLAMLLRMWGHHVRMAWDGPTALRLVEQEAPDVVLLDIGLPGMSGLDLAPRLKALCPAKAPLLVAVSGYGTDEDRERSQRAGIDLHLLKPVEPADLERLLDRFGGVMSVP